MGTRRQRRLRFVSEIMKILEDGEWHCLNELTNMTGLTSGEVSGLLRGEQVERMTERECISPLSWRMGEILYYRKPTDASVGGENCQVIGSVTESE